MAAYRLLWLLVLAAVLMAVYTAIGARVGCALDTTPLDYVARRAGRWLAAVVGVSAFLVVSGFQFGNNLGVAFALDGLTGHSIPLWVWPVGFTAAAISFLWSAKRVYRVLERVMLAMVGIMILCFVANLFWTGVDVLGVVAGIVPNRADLRFLNGPDARVGWALLATTFSVVGAFYQAYLVRAKGWGKEDLPKALGDAWTGIAVLAFLSGVIMIGSAQTLAGTGQAVQHVGQLSDQLRGILGPAAHGVFCAGLAAAAFSSFVVNAVVGGGLLADGFGLDAGVDGPGVKWCASAALAAGCLVAVLMVCVTPEAKTASLLIAQASTLLAVPLCALVLLILALNKRAMGNLVCGWPTRVVGVAGLVVLLWLARGVASVVAAQITGLLGSGGT